MRTAYLGIVDKDGLLAWWPEHPHLRRFVERRQGLRPRELCFWMVLPSEVAAQVTACLQQGECQLALRLLEQAESEVGRILPASSEISFCA